MQWCSVSQCDSEYVAVCCSITLFHRFKVPFLFGKVSVLQCVVTVCCFSVMQCDAVWCSALQCDIEYVAVCCSITLFNRSKVLFVFGRVCELQYAVAV